MYLNVYLQEREFGGFVLLQGSGRVAFQLSRMLEETKSKRRVQTHTLDPSVIWEAFSCSVNCRIHSTPSTKKIRI